jgi:hypothetical protein
MTDRICATGGCQCGAVRYAFLVPPEKSHVCHCRMCQRAVGNVFAALVGAPKDKIIFTTGTPTYFASSSLATRGFCSTCGTPLSFAYTKPDARFYVTIGSLDDPGIAPIIMQFGTESRIHWVDFCEDVPSEATGTGAEQAAFFSGMKNNQATE